MIKTEIDLNVIKRFCDDKKNWAKETLEGNCEKYTEYGCEPSSTEIDKTDTLRVLRKFYKFAWTNKNRDRSIILMTNKGTIIEDAGVQADTECIWINGKDTCIGDSEGSWSEAVVQIKTTSDFLAQLAVFANKHA